MNNENRTNKKLADIAGVKPTTYKMGAKVLNSDNEDLKQRVLSGKRKSISRWRDKNQGVEKLPQVENKIDVRAKLVGQQVWELVLLLE